MKHKPFGKSGKYGERGTYGEEGRSGDRRYVRHRAGDGDPPEEKGYTVYAMSRRAEGPKGIHHLRADVTNVEQVKTAVSEVLSKEKHIDLLVNNAGFGISGAIEFTEP